MKVVGDTPTLFFGIELEGMLAGERTLFVANDVPLDMICNYQVATNANNISFGAGGLSKINLETVRTTNGWLEEQNASVLPFITIESSQSFSKLDPQKDSWSYWKAFLQKKHVHHIFYFSENIELAYVNQLLDMDRVMIKAQRGNAYYIGWRTGHQVILGNDSRYLDDVLLWEQK